MTTSLLSMLDTSDEKAEYLGASHALGANDVSPRRIPPRSSHLSMLRQNDSASSMSPNAAEKLGSFQTDQWPFLQPAMEQRLRGDSLARPSSNAGLFPP